MEHVPFWFLSHIQGYVTYAAHEQEKGSGLALQHLYCLRCTQMLYCKTRPLYSYAVVGHEVLSQ